MNLKMSLQRGIYSCGLEKPSLVQQKVIVQMIHGKDIIAESQSGTGKTAAYAISTLQLIDLSETTNVQALILSPTRELAQQIGVSITNLSEYMNVKVQTFIGGTSLKADISNLSKGVHIVVGTPGRILELIKKKILTLTNLKLFILDEADEMLSRGFLTVVSQIQNFLPNKVQNGVFSATLQNKEILEIVDKITKDPIRVSLNRTSEEPSIEDITQFYIKVHDNDSKISTLIKLYQTLEVAQTFIYCNNKETVEQVGEELAKKGFSITCIHSDFSQTERDKHLRDFKSGKKRILVTSDLLARGIDISQIDLVVNYEIPVNTDTYIHRIGRTGRFGKKGTAFSFVNSREIFMLQSIQKCFNYKIEEFEFGSNTCSTICSNSPELSYPKRKIN
jgi:translation initiation factor 4A